MHTSYFWNMFDLHSRKIIFLILLLAAGFNKVSAQEYTQINLPYSDERWLHYGFSIGVHSSSFKLNYSDTFVESLDSVQSIMPMNSFGFTLGMIADFKLHEQFNLRVLPRFSFSEFKTEFTFIGDTSNFSSVENIEATFIEIPIMIKYKSQRHKNFRMYMVAGVVPGFEMSGKKRKERSENKLLIAGSNLSIEVGFGVDMYYPLFKFSPEIRYSRGLVNVLKEDEYGYSEGIDRLSTHSISLFFQFSD